MCGINLICLYGVEGEIREEQTFCSYLKGFIGVIISIGGGDTTTNYGSIYGNTRKRKLIDTTTKTNADATRELLLIRKMKN